MLYCFYTSYSFKFAPKKIKIKVVILKKHVIGALPGAITGGLTETDFT